MTSPRRISVIGVGKMGGGIARNLCTASESFAVTVCDVSPDAMEAFAQVGARTAPDPDSAARGADLVITSLPLPIDVLGVYRRIVAELPDGARCMDVSTIDPTTARAVSDLLAARGIGFVHCALGMGPSQAEAGTLPLFVGGDDADIDALEPILDRIGQRVHRMGSVEAASTFKLASNLVGMANLCALAEGVALCRHAGIEDGIFAEALADTGAWSVQAAMRLEKMALQDFTPGFSVALGTKDVGLAVALARKMGVPTPLGSAGLARLTVVADTGHAREDVSVVGSLAVTLEEER